MKGRGSTIILGAIVLAVLVVAAIMNQSEKTAPRQEPIIISVTCKHGVTYTRRFDKSNIIGFVGDGDCVVAVKYETEL